MTKVDDGIPTPSHVVITGASSGIGAALALQYAAPRRRLSLSARRGDLLDGVGDQCRARGADVNTSVVDVTDAAAVERWFASVDAQGAVDLLIVNAGVFDGHGTDGTFETAAEADRIIAVNLAGAIHAVRPAVLKMKERRCGRIALMSSLASVLPAADAPTYSATKAGLRAYAEALRMYLADYGVEVSVILPGHVETAQTAVHEGSLAMMITAEQAAAEIARGLQRGRAVIGVPRHTHWLVKVLGVLPFWLRRLLTRGDRFAVRKTGR